MNQISNPQVIIVSPNQTILSVIDALSETPDHISNLALVCNEDSKLIGVLNHADIIRLLSKGGDISNRLPAYGKDPIICRADLHVRRSLKLQLNQLMGEVCQKDYNSFYTCPQ